MKFPEDLKYTKDHEWVRVDGNVGTVGITDFAQGELGDIVYLDIATSSGEVGQGEVLGTIEAVKTVSDLFSPLSGIVVEVNSALNDNPETVNSDPYGAGWMVRIEFSQPSQLDELLSADEYQKLIGQ